MAWVEVGQPSRISSGVRADIRVTSYPSARRLSASCSPAWPAPTIRMLRKVRLLLQRPASTAGDGQRADPVPCMVDDGQQCPRDIAAFPYVGGQQWDVRG